MPEKITTTLNGQARQFTVAPEDSALEVIRQQAGLTGTKLVCGSGACGACTILVEGQPKCSCLLPAVHMHEKAIETVESHGAATLHPVQKAFLAHDALQCGYCTPGFINEGIAFYRQWRTIHGKTRPNKAQIAEALAGHLCRCGAYVGIYEAIATACTGDFDGPNMPEYLRVDGPAKVTGEAKYTTDIQLPGQLVGLIFRSPLPRARFKNLDLSKARNMPGVKAVIVLKEDANINFEGEPLAALAATDAASAYAALKTITAEFEPLHFLVDDREARKSNAPVIIPEGMSKGDIPVASEGPAFPGSWDGNVRKTAISLSSSKASKAKRATENAIASAPNTYAATFRTPTQFHTSLEPHCAVADWNSKSTGKLTVYASTQAVYFLAKDIAKAYKLKEKDVEVIAQYVGGAFGSKLTLGTETRTAIELSQAAGAPVAVVYSRAEEFSQTGFRPSGEMQVKVTADLDGKNAAFAIEAYGSSGFAIGSNIADVAGLNYTGLAKKLQDYDILTNFGPGCAFRGPGGPAACFAQEQSLDQLAHQLKLDPIAFRRQWEEDEGYRSLFKWVENSPLYQSRMTTERQTGRFRRGVGTAFGGWFHFYMPSAEVEVEVSDAGFVVRNAVQDMGQGARSVLAKAVADVFGIPIVQVRVEMGSSNLPIGPTSGGSRTTATIYPAAFEAAEKLRDTLLKRLEGIKDLKDAEVKSGGISHANGFIDWQEAISGMEKVSKKVRRGRNKQISPLEIIALSQGLVLAKNRGYGVYVMEVEVDTLLGKVRVTRVEGALRIGKVHVPPLARSQCYGGVIQGIGHALYEERNVCGKTGKLLSRGLEDYRLPGIGDTPEIKMDFLEEGFDFVNNKGIGLAELCTTPVAGAIANAVFNATGWRPLEAPISPEKVRAGINRV